MSLDDSAPIVRTAEATHSFGSGGGVSGRGLLRSRLPKKVDRPAINLRGKVKDQAEVFRKMFTFEEMRVMQDRIHTTIAAEERGNVVDAPSDSPRLS